MKVDLRETYCTVIRESGDPAFYGVREAAGESRLLYQVKVALNVQGYDFIKKRMVKDGHMVSETQQYLRSRKAPYVAIYNPRWAIEGAEREYNSGRVTLTVERDFGFGSEPMTCVNCHQVRDDLNDDDQTCVDCVTGAAENRLGN